MQDDFLKYRTNFGNGALGDIWAPCSEPNALRQVSQAHRLAGCMMSIAGGETLEVGGSKLRSHQWPFMIFMVLFGTVAPFQDPEIPIDLYGNSW